MEIKTKETVVDRLSKFNPAADKWISLGNHDSFNVSYDLYDKNKIEVCFDNNLTSCILSLIYDDDHNNFMIHLDDNTGAYLRDYSYDDDGVTQLLMHYQSLIQEINHDEFSIHDFIDRLNKYEYEYFRY